MLGDYYSPQNYTLRASKGLHFDWAPSLTLSTILAMPLAYHQETIFLTLCSRTVQES